MNGQSNLGSIPTGSPEESNACETATICGNYCPVLYCTVLHRFELDRQTDILEVRDHLVPAATQGFHSVNSLTSNNAIYIQASVAPNASLGNPSTVAV